MQPIEERFAREARRRRVRQRWISLAAVLLAFGLVPTSYLALGYAAASDRLHGAVAVTLAFGSTFAAWVSIFAATQLTWRCPRCGVPLPMGLGYQPEPVRVCLQCGCRLVIDWDELEIEDAREGYLGRQRLRREDND